MKELKKLKKRLIKKDEAIKRVKRLYPHLKILKDDILLEYLGLRDYDTLIEFASNLQAPNETIKDISSKKIIGCNCVDSNGYPKVLYRYQMEAKRAKEFISQRESIKLTIYPCPTSKGWHLSRV